MNMIHLEAENVASQVVKQAAAAATAVAAAAAIVLEALTAAELEVSESAAAAASKVTEASKKANLSETAKAMLQVAKKAAAETLQVAKKAAAESLQVAKEEALKIILIAKKMDKAMNQELRLRQQALNSISQGVLITDAERRITYINDAFEQITGYAKAELLGGNCAVLQGVGTNLETVNELRIALNSGQSFHTEILNYRKDGTPFWNDLSIIPVRDSEGNLTQFVGTQRDISENKAAAEQIEHLAFYDYLTDLPNRRLLMDRLNHAITSSQRSGREGAVLFIDLDNFKIINDTLGHVIGDLLIQQAAKRLESCIRLGDTIARLGGDEFVVVLEALSEQRIKATKQVNAIGKKILTMLNQPYQLDTHEHRNTASIGAVLFSDHDQSAEELLKRADIAMFQSKNAGRNTLTLFTHEMQNVLYERASMVREIRTALDKHEFYLYYQIQVDQFDNPVGAEALIRWISPVHGMVPPLDFIPLAEETGLILTIGDWVLETACAQLAIWQKNEQTKNLTVSVNISAKQFAQLGFVKLVKSKLVKYEIEAKYLKLEITESALLENLDYIIDSMVTLGSVGVQFSLDDFGTGYSSLQYLKKLPLNQIKIDKSFVRDLVTDSNDRSIVRTIIAMANSMSFDVIAEGVETIEQKLLLINKGCIYFQGYLFGKPMPIEEFEGLIRKNR
jgi:diguanylate cyclase (GGDEF)-like protein/PAS domain S-box-containing protein